MQDNFIYCEDAMQSFGKDNKAKSYNGDVSIKWLIDAESPKLITGAREYQREKVAPLAWKQNVVLTLLLNGYKKIPQIHIRASKRKNVFILELIDGQQRITSILDFLQNKYRLPNTSEFILPNGFDVRSMNIDDIRTTYPNLYKQILEHRINCAWYENLSDELTADLFINVLNNTNSMAPQEIRNAVRGRLSEYIRNTARFEIHNLFERGIVTKKDKSKKVVLKHFSESFTLKGRMEVDEWFSELIYLYKNGYKKGVNQSNHTEFIKSVQTINGQYATEESFFELKEQLDDLLEFSYKIITAVPTNRKYKLTSMLSMILILYGYELQSKYGKLIHQTYVDKFFKVYDDWSSTKKQLYINRTMYNSSKQLPPFDELFNGKNSKAISTIAMILDEELSKDEDSFGVIELDPRTTFSRRDIVKKWEEQNFLCHYTNQPLDIKDIAGDHYIPRSWGVKKGGVTEYHNLVVTSKTLNNRKLNIHGDDFIKMLNESEILA